MTIAGANAGAEPESGSYKAFMESVHKNLEHCYLVANYALSEFKSTKATLSISLQSLQRPGKVSSLFYAASNNNSPNALAREYRVELACYSIRIYAVIAAGCFTPLYDAGLKPLLIRKKNCRVL